MSFSLDGRVALVTGASRGIGAAMAEAYAAAGADVALVARDRARLDEVAERIRSLGRRAVAVSADVTDREALDAAVARTSEELGPVDILVNNAGGNTFMSPLASMRFSGWEKVLRLNLDSVVHASQAVLPSMIERTTGCIINVASVAGLQGAPMMSHYAAAKAAVVSLTQSLALEVAWAGVRVNALLPGWIETDLTQMLRAAPDGGRAVIDRVPMGRWGLPAEIAEPAVFMASDAASFMTGQVLVVDGGLSAMP